MDVPSLQTPLQVPRRIAVLGLGLAGCSLLRALALAKASFELVAFESRPRQDWMQAQATVGVLHPFVSKDHNLASQISQHALARSLQWLEDLKAAGLGFAGLQGVLENGEMQPGGWANLTWLRQACLQDAQARLGDRLSLHFSAQVTGVDVLLAQGFDAVFVTTGHARLLPKALQLDLTPISGQVSYFELDTIASAADRLRLESMLPDCVVCDEGTLTPLVNNSIYIGSSFHRGVGQAHVRPEDHRQNLARLAQFKPELAQALTPYLEQAKAWTGVRHASRDRLLHLGLAVHPQHSLSRSVSRLEQLPRWQGVYCLLGLGSRGLSTAPWAAECLVKAILGEPLPEPARLLRAIDPARFVLRNHVRA
jgi:glycine/D-amino acid oxidase-like deaminating enzyme